jgi:uncharacterized protein YecT (DUF1311 family)
MEQCLQSTEERGVRAHQCTGFVADPCMETEEGQNTAGMIMCIAREHAYWDALLNQSYRKLRESEENMRVEELRDLQRRWLAWREDRCAWEAGAHEGGSFANVVSNDCFLEETARRAIDLSNALEAADERFRLE